MARGQASQTFTMEFGREFEVEREAWLRTRFLWYTGVVAALAVSWLLITLLALSLSDPGKLLGAVSLTRSAMILLTAVVYAWAFWYVNHRTQVSRERLLRLVYTLIVAVGLLQLVAPSVASLTDQPGAGLGLEWIGVVFFIHVFACMFLPLTAWESYRPLVPLLVINGAFLILREPSILSVVSVVFTPIIGAPGALICRFRHSHFRREFTFRALRGRYAEMKRELVDARRLHESLFPSPIDSGPIRFKYMYEPMRQLGGDYLYVNRRTIEDDHELSIVLLDVTGHGISAALTVNRLHGELDRIFAEQPDIGPGEVLRLLNRYVYLTLATHSVYVTAMCVRVRTRTNDLEYASGGHPPAFLRAVDGSIEELGSTSLVLGVNNHDDFEPEPATLRFGPGDTLVAYTDGAMEAQNRAGKFFGLDRLRALLATGSPLTHGGWPETIVSAVDSFRFGPPKDDMLIVELARPIGAARLSRSGVPAQAAAAPADA